jgi:hypothetical protein
MTVVAFKTKTEVFAFCEEWRGTGSKARVIPTPKEIKIGCGFAVEISPSSLGTAYYFIKKGGFPTFVGIFTVKRVGGKTFIEKKL